MDSFQNFSLISVVQFWPLSLCHAMPGERVQGQLFVHALNKPMTGDILHAMSRMKNWHEVLEAVKQTVIIMMPWQNQLQRKLAA